LQRQLTSAALSTQAETGVLWVLSRCCAGDVFTALLGPSSRVVHPHTIVPMLLTVYVLSLYSAHETAVLSL